MPYPLMKGIKDRQKRIARFYNDGFLAEIGYPVNITIPKRYRRHFDAIGGDDTFTV